MKIINFVLTIIILLTPLCMWLILSSYTYNKLGLIPIKLDRLGIFTLILSSLIWLYSYIVALTFNKWFKSQCINNKMIHDNKSI